MISRIAVSGYRSLRDVTLPLGQLNVVTGANGTGKSSVYRALRLLADIADDRIISSLAKEGGFESVQWAGPETISRDMRAGRVPIQGTRRHGPVALKLGFTDEDLSYSIELGLGVPSQSLFGLDPVIKREVIWSGDKPSPSKRIVTRGGAGVQARDADHALQQVRYDMAPYESILRHVTGSTAPPELTQLRDQLGAWRFYDQIRTDADAPARQPRIGTRTVRLSPDGGDLASAVQTIFEIGDGAALNDAIELAFPGAHLDVATEGTLFRLRMRQTGILRALDTAELSDGTLRFILLATALLSPRPPPLMVLNEPEASLNGALIPALAMLIKHASADSQIIIVSHNRALVSTLLDADAELIELRKEFGETFAETSDPPIWVWPKR